MKRIFPSIITGTFIMLLSLMANAQQQTYLPCGMDDLVKSARDQNPDYDNQRAEEEKLRDQWKENALKRKQGTSIAPIVIPVVVHVVWNKDSAWQNISDGQIQSQIDVLNTDFMRLNADTVKTPAHFDSLAANPNIQFCLAQRDPLGNATNGIDRKQTTKIRFDLPHMDTSIWYTAKGGADAWDTSRYFNIWVGWLEFVSSPNVVVGGFGIWPTGVFKGSQQGIVVNYTFFGTMGTVFPPHDLGRSAVHETGHFLDLHHLWGDGGPNSSCTASDFINDTPTQYYATNYAPVYPYTTDNCSPGSPGIIFMDFMDYPNDSIKNMFTVDQCIRMNACLNGARASLLTSNTCTPADGISEILQSNDVTLYPNPAADQFSVLCPKATIHSIEVYDAMGQLIQRKMTGQKQEKINLNVSNGVYSVKIYTENNSVTKRLVIAGHGE